MPVSVKSGGGPMVVPPCRRLWDPGLPAFTRGPRVSPRRRCGDLKLTKKSGGIHNWAFYLSEPTLRAIISGDPRMSRRDPQMVFHPPVDLALLALRRQRLKLAGQQSQLLIAAPRAPLQTILHTPRSSKNISAWWVPSCTAARQLGLTSHTQYTSIAAHYHARLLSSWPSLGPLSLT